MRKWNDRFEKGDLDGLSGDRGKQGAGKQEDLM